jgi:hypothetical protein
MRLKTEKSPIILCHFFYMLAHHIRSEVPMTMGIKAVVPLDIGMCFKLKYKSILIFMLQQTAYYSKHAMEHNIILKRVTMTA